ncbi:MAG: CAP domain-containing protein, partial [Chloroflexi bacterium]|nr:CAP domain-containing protein [Chloroflexota bacterium]
QPTEAPEPRTDEIQEEAEAPVSAAPAVEAEVAQVPDETAPETLDQAAEAHAAAPRVADVASAAVPFAGDVEGFRAQLLALYNQVRATAGLATLSWSPALQQSAQLHAEDCAQRGYGSHVGSDGADTRMRIVRAGYVGSVTGENWAWGQTAQQVFEAWFTQEYPSGPHRDNILSAHYNEVGFGIAPASGGYYFIANFGTP